MCRRTLRSCPVAEAARTTASTGPLSQAHDNMQPSAVLAYVIKL